MKLYEIKPIYMTEDENDYGEDSKFTLRYRVGDEVWVEWEDARAKGAVITRIGRTQIHVKHRDGTTASYNPKYVAYDLKDLPGWDHSPKGKKKPTDTKTGNLL